MTISMDAIRVTFFQECEEQLADLESGLVAIEEGTADPDIVNAVFRAAHSIKGGAGAFQLTDIVAFAHGFETALDALRSNSIEPRPAVMRVFLRAADMLADLVAAGREGRVADADWRGLLAEVDAVTRLSGQAEDLPEMDGTDEFGFIPLAIEIPMPGDIANMAGTGSVAVFFRPHRSMFDKANDPIPVLRELRGLGLATVSCCLDDLPFLDALDPNEPCLAWRIEIQGATEAAVRECFEFVDGDCDLLIEPLPASPIEALADPAMLPLKPPPPFEPQPSRPDAAKDTVKPEAASSEHASAPTIRVDLDRVDRLINLVGELVINQSMLVQRVNDAGVEGLAAVGTGLDELKRLTRETQESVMAIRAQPVRPLFQRMGRITREVAAATGKMVRLRTEGEGTEVDKTVIERLADPLTHLIRNAIDHGIETPDRRREAGKPEEGTVRLVAAHRSGRVLIEVADDGAGIDRTRVRDIAVQKGLVAADAQLGDTEIDNLLFLPGFSTVKTVSDISGRGVGMDVVKRSIQALGGRLTVSSRPGHGSSFVMSLPLTLAVLDGMVVSVGGQTLVLPLSTVTETVHLQPGALRMIGASSRVLAIRGGFLPVVEVGSELGFSSPGGDADPGSDKRVAVLVETSEGQRFALLVDSIQDQRQVVIKSLEANYGRVPGIAAATILGDGKVALILDVDAMLSRKASDGPSLSLPLNAMIHTGAGA